MNITVNLNKSPQTFSARIMHFRNRDNKGQFMPIGGGTVISIFNPDRNQVNMFSARCNMKDRFSRKKGIEICIRKMVGRLFKVQVDSITTDDKGNFSITTG